MSAHLVRSVTQSAQYAIERVSESGRRHERIRRKHEIVVARQRPYRHARLPALA